MKEMNRREFLTLSGAAVVALSLAGCGGGPSTPPAPPAVPTGKEAELVAAINKVWKKKFDAGLVDHEQLTLNQDAQKGIKIQGGLFENAQKTVYKVTEKDGEVMAGVAGWEVSMEQKYGADCLAGVAGISPASDNEDELVISLDFEYSCEDADVQKFVEKLLTVNSNDRKAEFISIYCPVVQGKTYMIAVVFRNTKA